MQLFKNINAKELAALMTLVACFGFITYSIIVEPTGEIHPSVNQLVIEMFSFAGVCLGLDYFAHRTTHKHKSSNPPKPKGNGQEKGNAK